MMRFPKILNITILVYDHGMDNIFLELDIPCAVYSDKKMVTMMHAPSRGGEDYVKEHFPSVEYEVVERK